jgi:hypothetical protein
MEAAIFGFGTTIDGDSSHPPASPRVSAAREPRAFRYVTERHLLLPDQFVGFFGREGSHPGESTPSSSESVGFTDRVAEFLL